METPSIEKSIDLAAPPQRVWEVLFGDQTYRQWSAAFMPGSYADTDWQEGSTVRFLDPAGSGLVGHIVTSRAPQLMDIEYDGLVADGTDDTASATAMDFRGTRETYRLTAIAGGTHLAISAPMGEEYLEEMTAAWEVALGTLRQLVETTEPSEVTDR